MAEAFPSAFGVYRDRGWRDCFIGLQKLQVDGICSAPAGIQVIARALGCVIQTARSSLTEIDLDELSELSDSSVQRSEWASLFHSTSSPSGKTFFPNLKKIRLQEVSAREDELVRSITSWRSTLVNLHFGSVKMNGGGNWTNALRRLRDCGGFASLQDFELSLCDHYEELYAEEYIKRLTDKNPLEKWRKEKAEL